MYTAQLIFSEGKSSNNIELLETLNTLISAYRMNGQVLGREFPISEEYGHYSVFVQIPDKDSLSPNFNNKYVKKNLSKLEEDLVHLEVRVLGIDPDSSTICNCKSMTSYVLYTDYLSLESPLRCGECFGGVPLYRIPKTFDDEYYDIIHWMSDYQSCDSLQMNCRVGERFATDQLSKLNSSLTKEGLSVCESIRKVTGKNTYYYLYKGTGLSYESEIRRRCPSCNEEWHEQEPFHGIFDFRCDQCALLSNVAWSLRR